MEKVNYDFEDTAFKKNPQYRRYAREHIEISKLKSDRIKVRVRDYKDKVLKIPNEYEVDYHITSIVGINEDKSPIYGDKHTIKVVLPENFPITPFKAYALSDIWHPNIKWSGHTKGRICANNRDFGRAYDLRMLILRIGEIIQYKNYLAENVPPYPEDAQVAKWILEYAEPNGIVKQKEKFVDDSNLLEYTPPIQEEKPKIIIKSIKTKEKKGNIVIKNINKKRNSAE